MVEKILLRNKIVTVDSNLNDGLKFVLVAGSLGFPLIKKILEFQRTLS